MVAVPEGYFVLCGTMFHADLARRHRLFEARPYLWSPQHPDCRGYNKRLAARLGVDWRDVQAVGHGRGRRSRVWPTVLGIDWADTYGMSQAIPPAYTEWIGRQLMAHLQQAAA